MTNYLSVSEYAKLNNKDPGNIRRFLASGRISGTKIGKQWVIKENTAYPKDKRETSGKYRNYRKKLALNKNKKLINIIQNIINNLQEIYGEQLIKVIIYGSYARGTQTDESDVDIALIINGTPAAEATDKMMNCVASYELEYGKVLSVIDIDSDKYEAWKNVIPFYRNIKNEGITLWMK